MKAMLKLPSLRSWFGKRDWRVRYEILVWVAFLTITVLAIVDRFTWNVWPRQTMRIGNGTAGSDFMGGLKPGPWSVKVYDVIARVSGRYSICALNLLLFTTMNTFMAWLAGSWIAKWLVDCADEKDANSRLHKWNGIALCVTTVIHVWSIILPGVVDQYRILVVPGRFEWILSERTPPGFKDANPETMTMMMQVDDVFRIVTMTLLLCVLMPLSIHWLKTRWHLGIHVHRFIMVIYFVDIVRRHSHPHSWILNTPFFVLWIVDNVVGYFWRREKPSLYRLRLSDDYMILFWSQAKTTTSLGSEQAGAKYFVRLNPSSLLERAHVFTAFENRRELDMAGNDVKWTVGLVVRVYRNRRRPVLGRRDKISHTERIFEQEQDNFVADTWGPYPGTMSEKIMRSLHREDTEVCIIAGGSAAGYLLDVLLSHGGECPARMTVLYTTRDLELFRYVAKWVGTIIDSGDGGGKLRVLLAMTAYGEKAPACADSEGQEPMPMRLQTGRICFEEEIPPRCRFVYFQGSGGLQNSVQRACRKVKSRLIAGPAFDNAPATGNSVGSQPDVENVSPLKD